MNGEAVKELTALAQMDLDKQTIVIGGQDYSARQLHRIAKYEPKATAVGVSTLQGFVEFINQNPDGFEYTKHFIHVVSHQEVRLCSQELGEDRKREYPVVATLDKELQSFPFGSWVEGEMFVIYLRSLFVMSEHLEKLIAYTGKVSIDEGITVSDDGISQTAKVQRGMSGHLKEEEAARVIVTLTPYRTFREVEQPASDFLFRMRQSKGGGIECALFEADGGAWRIEAVSDIQDYMTENLPEDLSVFA